MSISYHLGTVSKETGMNLPGFCKDKHPFFVRSLFVFLTFFFVRIRDKPASKSHPSTSIGNIKLQNKYIFYLIMIKSLHKGSKAFENRKQKDFA